MVVESILSAWTFRIKKTTELLALLQLLGHRLSIGPMSAYLEDVATHVQL